jgi:hypothetical protein
MLFWLLWLLVLSEVRLFDATSIGLFAQNCFDY